MQRTVLINKRLLSVFKNIVCMQNDGFFERQRCFICDTKCPALFFQYFVKMKSVFLTFRAYKNDPLITDTPLIQRTFSLPPPPTFHLSPLSASVLTGFDCTLYGCINQQTIHIFQKPIAYVLKFITCLLTSETFLLQQRNPELKQVLFIF